MAGNPRSSQVTGHRPPIAVGFALVASITLAALGCAPPSELPDGTIPRVPPVGVNGMASGTGALGGELWAADLFGGQLLRFELDSGRIAERYGPFEGLCGTDDLVVLPEGDLVATCPGTGEVIRVERGGGARVLAHVGNGVNPIELDPDGHSVLVGFGTDEHDELLRIPVDGGPPEVIADGLPVLNGFAFGPDGLLYVPTGGAGGLFGSGGLAAIDPATGAIGELELSFEDPSRRGFDFACGTDVASDGTVFVAQCIGASLFAVDPATGIVSLVGHSPLQLADNVTVLEDGRVLLSGFLGPKVAVFTPRSDGSWHRSVAQVGT